MGEALQGLHRVCAEVRFLGSYPRAARLRRTPRRRPALPRRPPAPRTRTSSGRSSGSSASAPAARLNCLRAIVQDHHDCPHVVVS
jgi:prephenate dehydratase